MKNQIRNSPDFPLFNYLMSILIFGIGCVFAFLMPAGYASYQLQTQAKLWPTTQGTIVSSKVKESQHFEFDAKDYKYQASVMARYSVDGKHYQTFEIYAGQTQTSTNSYASAQKKVVRYPVGAKIKVYYNPAKPSVGVLEPGVKTETYVFLAFAVSCALLSLYLFFWAIKRTYIFLRYYSSTLVEMPSNKRRKNR